MTVYEVKLKTTAEVKRYVEVEAKSKEEALSLAKALLAHGKLQGEDEDWEVSYMGDYPIKITDVGYYEKPEKCDSLQNEDGL
jgi:hypothetical protein